MINLSNLKNLVLDGEENLDDKIMGIDLGTTNSAVAIYDAGTVPSLCPMGNGNRFTLQSCVRWDGGDNFTVGPDAYEERFKSNVIYSVKRIMGTDSSITLTREDGSTKVMTPVEVSAEILKALKNNVNEYFPGMHRCIITVPAYFNQRQIEDTGDAAKLAGLDCVQILKEPTSASYIYSLLGHAQEGSVLIYDLGGGTFDITHMDFLNKKNIDKKQVSALKRMYNIDVMGMNASADDSNLYFCRVQGTYGDSCLGGDDIDRVLAEKVVKEQGVNFTAEEFERLKLYCEKFKKLGVSGQQLTIGGKEVLLKSTDLNAAIKVIFDRTMKIVENIPEDELNRIRTVVLVGGSTKSSTIVNLLRERFPDKEISRVLDPDSTVALGAAAVAKDIQNGKGIRYQDVLPMAIGILENEKSIDMCINKNTSLPYSTYKLYRTMYDNQECVSIHVYQGVSTKPEECTFLGTIKMDNLPPKPAGKLDIKVSFVLNAQGRLKVTTFIDGVHEEKELIVDSILNVSNEKKITSTNESLGDFVDDFERSISDLANSNDTIVSLLLERRKAIAAKDEKLISDIEDKIFMEV